MHLRRALLLFALVLGLTALAAAVSPTRETADSADDPPRGAPAARGAEGLVPRTITFRAREGVEATDREVRLGDHVVVSVTSPAGGVATIPRLGRTASASPASPARFDLLANARGRYDVLFAESSSDEPRRVGTLVVSGGG
jgi:hypothetical protein